MAKLTTASKVMIAMILAGSTATAAYTRRDRLRAGSEPAPAEPGPAATAPAATAPTATVPAATVPAATAPPPAAPVPAAASAAALPTVAPMPGRRPVKVALSQWPGHLALVVGNGGLTTQPGSAAALEGLGIEIVFIEDAPSKNKALVEGKIDAVWETVDELPISLGTFAAAQADARAFLQIDWSRGGDACVATKEVQTVEDVLGRKSAVLMFSPDHTVFEFMLSNSRLTPAEAARVRADTSFSMDDFTYARILFGKGKIDVACLWEPDVTLALASRPGAHRLFSTADATELVADTLVAKKEFLDLYPDLAVKLARVWFAGVRKAEADRPAAARLISTVCSRFRDELGYDATLKAFSWVKWTGLADNVRLFGLDGKPAAFDRVYTQAEGVWVKYPQAEIKTRFAPANVRDDRVVRRIWEAEGKNVAAREEKFRPGVAATGKPLFTKPLAVTFHSGKSELTHNGLRALDEIVMPQVQMAAGMYIRVEGNTDSLGDEDWNRGLSERRAEAIVDHLVSRGVERNRIVARGNGSAKAVASNKSAEGRARNRRTDILFIPSNG